MFSRIGITELLVILGIIVILFGARKIPEIMENMGKGIKKFKDTQKDDHQDKKSDD